MYNFLLIILFYMFSRAYFEICRVEMTSFKQQSKIFILTISFITVHITITSLRQQLHLTQSNHFQKVC